MKINTNCFFNTYLGYIKIPLLLYKYLICNIGFINRIIAVIRYSKLCDENAECIPLYIFKPRLLDHSVNFGCAITMNTPREGKLVLRIPTYFVRLGFHSFLRAASKASAHFFHFSFTLHLFIIFIATLSV